MVKWLNVATHCLQAKSASREGTPGGGVFGAHYEDEEEEELPEVVPDVEW